MNVRPLHGPSLEEWEDKTKLSELERQSVFELHDSCAELPLPAELLPALPNSPIPQIHSPGTASPESQLQTPPRSPTAAATRFTALPTARLAPQSSSLQRSLSTTQFLAESAAADNANAQKDAIEMGFDKPIDNIQQFFDWFAQTELEMEQDQEDIYRSYLATVLLYRQSCDDFLQCIDDTVQLFSGLEGDYKFVEEQTRALQNTCEDLLAKQDRLSKLADSLAEGLAYFNHLEPISKQFNAANEDICTSPSFLVMLRQLDESITYVEKNIRYRDSELYLMRFRQCMTRGMTYIKMYIIKTLRDLGYDVYKKTSQKGQKLSAAAQTTLLYAKFRAESQKIRPLAFELEKRCKGHKEYYSLMTDTINSYIQVRQQLLSPIITSNIQELGPYNDNVLDFARNGCGYMMNVCYEEFQLFYCFFDSGEEELYSYFELLLSYLYDYLRPRIIKENRIEVLSDLCNIFQLQIIRDLEGADVNNERSLAFSYLVRNILQDAQGRLVFRAESYIHSDIEKYIPTTADLDYPNILQSKRRSSIVLSPPAADATPTFSQFNTPATLDVSEDSDGSGADAEAETEKHTSPTASTISSPPNAFTDNNVAWFPTLQRTLWILSKLYRCVRTTVFEDLAQEAVSICKQSLAIASENVSMNHSKLDGQLFLIKHLLILKEQLAPFEANLVHAGKELDFSHVNVALSAFAKGRTSIFNPNALFDIAQSGIPRVVEISIDSRREIDRELKRICEDFIMECSQSSTEPLSNFITQVSAFQVANNSRGEKQRLSNQTFATPDSAYQVYESFREAVNARLTFTMRRLSQYLDDKKMEVILLRPIQMNIVSRYRQYYDILINEYDVETLSKQPPTPESMAMWISQLVEEGKEIDDGLLG
ncbi:Sec34-like family-domain-containing protein [Umbelopsis sp. PMI_123]|nr:Sec34-like family-domain-containing protein [Umbelopsis sp. PMI_123]